MTFWSSCTQAASFLARISRAKAFAVSRELTVVVTLRMLSSLQSCMEQGSQNGSIVPKKAGDIDGNRDPGRLRVGDPARSRSLAGPLLREPPESAQRAHPLRCHTVDHAEPPGP